MYLYHRCVLVLIVTSVLVVTGMYSLYHPVLADSQPSGSASSASASVGYQVLAAASDGQLTLTEITPKLEKSDEDPDDVEDVTTVTAPEFCEVQTAELAAGSLDMIVECTGTT